MDFSNFSSNIKTIAFYSPIFYQVNKSYQDFDNNNLNKWNLIKDSQILFKGHHQPRNPGDKEGYLEYYNLANPEIIKKQVKLAKSHGIFGFAIYYYWSLGKVKYEIPLKVYLENKDIDFPFLLIWKNINCPKLSNNSDIYNNLKYSNENPYQFIKDIIKYIIDVRYIKINGKPIIGIYDNYEINRLYKTINIWRKVSKQYKIPDIYIIINQNNYNIEYLKKVKLFDSIYEFYPNDNLINFSLKRLLTRIYTSIIYFNNNLTKINNDFPIFRCSMLEWDNSLKKNKKVIVFDSYSPEQFYILNKIMIQWTKNIYNNTNLFFFINSWNDWEEGCYLEPDEKYGYSSINSFSKALFNLNYKEKNNNISELIGSIKVAIQAHLFYEDLAKEAILKINNIPVKYDLFITTTSLNKSKIIDNYAKIYSNANNYYIQIVENKGRDAIPFLEQIKKVYKKYKYICHIHSKKSKHNSDIATLWKNYLFDNLLGSQDIISEILSDFESFEKLGFIFPENFFYILSDDNDKREPLNKIHVNYLLEKMFPNQLYKAGDLLDFPHGNMFWAKISAIYQIFEINIKDKVPNENGQVDCTIMHGIERIWLYLVKINGYYYKKIFKNF